MNRAGSFLSRQKIANVGIKFCVGYLLCFINKKIDTGQHGARQSKCSQSDEHFFVKIVVTTNFKLKDQGSLFLRALILCIKGVKYLMLSVKVL